MFRVPGAPFWAIRGLSPTPAPSRLASSYVRADSAVTLTLRGVVEVVD
ncbi:hypothetical protein GCM10027070_33100 [Barrientosiimonas humi]